MKVIEILSTAILFVLPGAMYAQEQREQEKQPEQKQAKPAQPQAKPAQAKPAQQQTKPAQQPQRAQAQPQAKPTQQQTKPAQQPQRAQEHPQAKPTQQQTKPAPQPQHAQAETRPAQPAASHGRIPDDRFRASFGSGHTFHVNRSEFAGGSGRFQYGGFWFAMVNPWPVAWLYTDAVYVDYLNGGYFLCDPVHPGVYLSINLG
jgi:hypothetical protein